MSEKGLFRMTKPISNQTPKVAVVGLGYVGLPLAVEFGKKYDTVGFDINAHRISQLRDGVDSTLEISKKEMSKSPMLSFSDSEDCIKDADIYIVTVPTPIDKHRRPDLSPLVSASKLIGRTLSKGNIVVYESTVYPGATEEVCVPLLEEISGLTYNQGFFVGYSPERINPGDKTHRVCDIMKVTSGSTDEAAVIVDELYQSIINAGTHLAPSIKVAEAAKVIENTQRDLNIALINELAIIFNRLDIDTEAVLTAAATKWNFLQFRPGLVGGHCIGVDPYYLTHKAQEIGYLPQVILAGRRINDDMPLHIVAELIKLMIRKKIQVANAKVLIMGLAFKEDCPDIRNTKVIDIVTELISFGVEVDVHDPNVDAVEVNQAYGLNLVELVDEAIYDAVVVAVAHKQFKLLSVEELRSFSKPVSVIYDIKHLFPPKLVDGRL
jgi:UDP-N-acetyl-D-glucosamine/UDP-N-acetyl-D-galactosamine dehydrogenase